MEAIDKFFIEDCSVKEISSWKEVDDNTYIYEVIKIINGKPLFYEEHYKRMRNSCELASSNLNISEKDLKKLINKLVEANQKYYGNIKIIYSAKNGSLRIFFVKHFYPTSEMYNKGVKAIIYFAERKNPNAKIINSGFRKKINKKITEEDAYEAILVNKNNLVTEGSKSNIFFIRGGCVFTSKVEAVLPGVTRTKIINMAKYNNIDVVEEDIKVEMIEQYESAFISGTSLDILPIRQIENIRFDVKDEVLLKLIKLFKKTITEYIE